MSLKSSGILQTISGEIERLAESAGRSVVSVSSGHGNGSGIVWDERTVVTAYHVVRGAEEVSVGTEDGKKLTAKVTGRFRRSDIAVLTVEGQLAPIEKADSGCSAHVTEPSMGVGGGRGELRTIEPG